MSFPETLWDPWWRAEKHLDYFFNFTAPCTAPPLPAARAHAEGALARHLLVLRAGHHAVVGDVLVPAPQQKVLELRRLEGAAEVHGGRVQLLALLDPAGLRARHLLPKRIKGPQDSKCISSARVKSLADSTHSTSSK